MGEWATAAAPAPHTLAPPAEKLLSVDPPGSSEDGVHIDFVSKLSLSVLQQDSLFRAPEQENRGTKATSHFT